MPWTFASQRTVWRVHQRRLPLSLPWRWRLGPSGGLPGSAEAERLDTPGHSVPLLDGLRRWLSTSLSATCRPLGREAPRPARSGSTAPPRMTMMAGTCSGYPPRRRHRHRRPPGAAGIGSSSPSTTASAASFFSAWATADGTGAATPNSVALAEPVQKGAFRRHALRQRDEWGQGALVASSPNHRCAAWSRHPPGAAELSAVFPDTAGDGGSTHRRGRRAPRTAGDGGLHAPPGTAGSTHRRGRRAHAPPGTAGSELTTEGDLKPALAHTTRAVPPWRRLPNRIASTSFR